MRLIDADALRQRMYHEAFETDTDMQKWDSGCWIRYKLFENCIESAHTVSPDEVRGVGCEVCNYDKPLPQEELSHDFYIHDGAIYHYDSELGWEGTDIAFCPFCGKRLRMKGAEGNHTMDEFMYGQEMGSHSDGSL